MVIDVLIRFKQTLDKQRSLGKAVSNAGETAT